MGSLEAKESVLLKAEAEGRVRGIFFEEGDWLKEGQVLVKLNDAKIKATMAQLQARLRQMEVQLANSERTLQRKAPLLPELPPSGRFRWVIFCGLVTRWFSWYS